VFAWQHLNSFYARLQDCERWWLQQVIVSAWNNWAPTGQILMKVDT
jgi:hypothetical protein